MHRINHGRRHALKTLSALTALAGGGIGTAANASNPSSYPSRPITLIVPQPVGGDADAICRMLQPHWQSFLGQSVVIDNRAGAAGSIGTAAGSRAAPDGYTLTFVNQGTMAINPFLYKDTGYKVEDLEPVSWMTSIDLIICAHPSVPANNLAELMELARKKPGEFFYGTAGNGSANHLAGEMLKSMAGIDLAHVPYRGGGPALIGTLGGETNLLVAFPLAALPHIRNGKLRALAVTGSQRNPALPDVPTVAESGVPGYEFVSWMGLVAPKGTPSDIIDRVADVTRQALSVPEVSELMRSNMVQPTGEGPAAFRDLIQRESKKMSSLIAQFKVSLD